MRINSLSILNYKNIKEANLLFSDNINCFIGRNGMGKTNVLDAIYYLSFCKSHSNPIDSQNIEHEAEFCLIQGSYALRGQQEEVSCGIKRRQKKQFRRNKKTYERLADHIGLLPLVLISPDDTELIADGSDERRKFMDGVISQYDKVYLNHLLSYNNALKQRNALLKNEVLPDSSLFEIWEDRMADHADYVFQERSRFIEQFTPIFTEFYNIIAENQESVSLNYVSQMQDRDLREAFARTRERDHILGYTTQGIHKDDLEMMLGGYTIKRVGSQGQNKTYLVALKLAQFEFLKRTHGIAPLLLLDDIFDKLDSRRVQKIVELVAGDRFGQIFITDTNREYIDTILQGIPQPSKLFYVENGNIQEL